MDVLGICDRIVDDYREFVGGFVLQDALIREHVGKRLADGYQSAPRLSLSHSFAAGSTIGDLVGAQLLRPEA